MHFTYLTNTFHDLNYFHIAFNYNMIRIEFETDSNS